jgi:hypothetical protein
MKSVLKLFNALPIKEKKKERSSKELLDATIKKGFIFSPEVVYNYSENELINLIKEIGLTGEQLNNAFHKSWKKIKEASIEELVLDQILHYITTYGFEEMGVYDKDLVYIPTEKLNVPKINVEKIPLMVIKGYTKEELKVKLLNLLSSGIALAEDTKNDVIDVITFVGLKEDEINNINNKEVRIAFYDYLDILPKDPIEFLRYMIYKSTNRTLLIKDKITINEIKTKDNLGILNLINKYEVKYGLEKLAEIFYRFKPLFLAFKTNSGLNSKINRIRKLAEKYHKPMKEDYLNEVTGRIKHGYGALDIKKLNTSLNEVNIFRKIRLAYALKFRTEEVNSIIYRIRNGKSWTTDFKFDRQDEVEEILNIVLGSITEDIVKNVEGKKIYIPKYIKYTLPATEKQFTGNFPSGTYISIPKDMIFGIHWDNVGNNRIDLDLSLIDQDGGKLGWDGSYRSEGATILFSGDMIDASNGASELFYIKKQKEISGILFVNYFNCQEKVEVLFKIIVGKETIKTLNHNYMVNPNNILSIAQSKINNKQKILGLLVATPEECKFYYAETQMGNSITSYGSPIAEKAREYLFNFYTNTISLNDILEKAGAEIVTKEEEYDIDLSPEKLEKDTILNLLISKKE